MEQNTKSSIKDLAFVVPEDIKFDKDISGISDIQLQRWHDMMHVFFEKLLLGLGEFAQFKWSFNRVIAKHHDIVEEMTKRGIYHHTPINNLDKIIPHKTSNSKSLNLSKNDRFDISFNEPKRVNKVSTEI